MALFTEHTLIEVLKEQGEEFGYKVDKHVDYDYVENTATISYLGDNDKLLLSVVVLYGAAVHTKINIFDQNDQNIFSKSVRQEKYDKNEYQDVINKVQEELEKNLDYVSKKIEDKLYKVKKVAWHSDLEKEINKMAKEGYELKFSMVSQFQHDTDSHDIDVKEYKLIFRRQK